MAQFGEERELSFPSTAQFTNSHICPTSPNSSRYLDNVLHYHRKWAAGCAYTHVVLVTFLVVYCIYICKCCSYCDVTFMFER